jgi:hypothetical protein
MLDYLPERVIRFRLSDLTILFCNAAWAAGHSLTPAEVVGLTMGSQQRSRNRVARQQLRHVTKSPRPPDIS